MLPEAIHCLEIKIIKIFISGLQWKTFVQKYIGRVILFRLATDFSLKYIYLNVFCTRNDTKRATAHAFNGCTLKNGNKRFVLANFTFSMECSPWILQRKTNIFLLSLVHTDKQKKEAICHIQLNN